MVAHGTPAREIEAISSPRCPRFVPVIKISVDPVMDPLFGVKLVTSGARYEKQMEKLREQDKKKRQERRAQRKNFSTCIVREPQRI